MEKIRVYLCLSDVAYGRRLLGLMTGKNHPALQFELVTSRQEEGDYKEGEYCLTDWESLQGKKGCFYLSEVGTDRDLGRIFRYQKGEDIYGDLLDFLDLDAKEASQGIYVIYSQKTWGGDLVGLVLSQELGERSNCLYVNLDPFCPWSQGGEESLSDLLFSPGLSGAALRDFGLAKCLPGFIHYRDFLDCKASDLEGLLKLLMGEEGFESGVLVMSGIQENFLDIMSLGNEIIYVEEEGPWGQREREILGEICKREGRKDLLERVKICPLAQEWQEIRETWEKTQMGDWSQLDRSLARRILEGRCISFGEA